MKKATLSPKADSDEVLPRMELLVARRADVLARDAEHSRASDWRCWRQAEQEIFGYTPPDEQGFPVESPSQEKSAVTSAR